MKLDRLTWMNVFSACLLAIAFSAGTNAQHPRGVRWNAPPDEWQWVVPDKVPGLIHGTVMSASMSGEAGSNIHLPPSYDKSASKRYPVVFFVHGASGSERSDADPSTVRRLIAEGKIGDVIYVDPNGGHFSRYRDWDEGNVKAETLLIRELIPHIDHTYRTIAERGGRAFSGWSMGGDASLRFAFKYPEMFCAAATISAAIDWGAADDNTDTIFAHSLVPNGLGAC